MTERQNACPMPRDYNSGMGVVDLLDQKTAAYKLDRKSSSGRYYLRLFFGLMDTSVCKFACSLQSIITKGNGFTRFQNCSG